MGQRLGRCLVINPGSAGEARDMRNGRLLTCCVLDTASGELVFKDYEDPRFAKPAQGPFRDGPTPGRPERFAAYTNIPSVVASHRRPVNQSTDRPPNLEEA